MTYERPQIADYGSLVELTAMLNVGGPVDTYAEHPPGHSCPTGPPGPNENTNSSGLNQGDPRCVGQGGGVGGGNDFEGDPDFNPENPGSSGGG
jgi:hypothetical protein